MEIVLVELATQQSDLRGVIYLVPQPLTRNDCDLITYSLVGLEVECEFWIVALNDDLGRLLHSL